MGEFQAGDIVQLKSGGPRMTVKNRQESGSLWCVWFDGPTLHEGSFAPESLFGYDADRLPIPIKAEAAHGG